MEVRFLGRGISEQREFGSASILKVEVKSTGYKGGDSGHGSRHYLSLHNEAATSWYVKVKDSDGKTGVFDQPSAGSRNGDKKEQDSV